MTHSSHAAKLSQGNTQQVATMKSGQRKGKQSQERTLNDSQTID